MALITDRRGGAWNGALDGVETHRIRAGGLAGKSFAARLQSGPELAIGTWQARGLLKRLGPRCVVGFGGYASVPTMLAASFGNYHTAIHEQNAVLGRVNRLLAGKVDAIATAYPQIERLKPKHSGKVHLVGNPVRAEVLALREEEFPALGEEGLFRVLVTGGSQGARVLSEVVPDGLSMLPPALRQRLQVTQQCRPEDLDAVRERYRNHGIPAELATYFEDMAARLADTHLFIGRAGASTIAELTAVGRPAILVPLPIATDDHQAANARELSKSGGARMIRQERFTGKELAKQIKALAENPQGLANAAHAAWNCGRPKAVEDLADLVESFGGAEMMDVIRVGGNNARGASQGIAAGQAMRQAHGKRAAREMSE